VVKIRDKCRVLAGRTAADHAGVVRRNKAVRVVKAPAFGNGIGEVGAQGMVGLGVAADRGHARRGNTGIAVTSAP
jgi:hypothetical protein